jgi:NADH-quinone oxidoreductase subunit C
MENNTIIQHLKEKFTDVLLAVDEVSDVLTLEVSASGMKRVVVALKNDWGFTFLTDLCGIHYPEQRLELGVVYHFQNLIERKRIRIKTFVSKESPQVESIADLFSGANWMERETFDFYGIDFTGHPNLTRILNVEFMDYHPMRKEYPLEDATREDKDDRYFGR